MGEACSSVGLALPRLRGRKKTDRRRSRKLRDLAVTNIDKTGYLWHC